MWPEENPEEELLWPVSPLTGNILHLFFSFSFCLFFISFLPFHFPSFSALCHFRYHAFPLSYWYMGLEDRGETYCFFLSSEQRVHAMQDRMKEKQKERRRMRRRRRRWRQRRRWSEAEYTVRSNDAFSGESKFTFPYSSVCACVVSTGASDTKFVTKLRQQMELLLSQHSHTHTHVNIHTHTLWEHITQAPTLATSWG